MINISPSEFRTWQLAHYTQRLSEARTVEERSFLRAELHRPEKSKTMTWV
jgi:hypothetical protein